MLTILQNVFWNKCLTDFQDGGIVACTCLNAPQTWIGFITMFSISCGVSSKFAK